MLGLAGPGPEVRLSLLVMGGHQLYLHLTHEGEAVWSDPSPITQFTVDSKWGILYIIFIIYCVAMNTN